MAAESMEGMAGIFMLVLVLAVILAVLVWVGYSISKKKGRSRREEEKPMAPREEELPT
jgi:hypothetical protein